MEWSQVTALYANIIDIVKGKTKPDELSAQKKTPEKTTA
jgi:hypothetical protein